MARRTVKLTDAAVEDLNEAKRWLSQPGAGDVARRRHRALSSAIRTLRDEPMRYRHDPDDPRQRIISVAGYRIIYAVNPDTGDNQTSGDVEVLAVLGPGEP